MQVNRKLLKRSGDPEVYSIRYKNYPLSTIKAWNFAAEDLVLPFYISSAGEDIWHCKGYSERLNSSILSLEYVQEGEFVFEQSGEICHVKSGEMFLVYPGKSSAMYCRPVTARKRMIILRGSMLKMIADSLNLDKINKFVPADRKILDDFFDEISSALGIGSRSAYHQACALCYNLLIEIASQSDLGGCPSKLRPVLDFMQSRLYGKLTLAEVAEFAGISQTGINQLFHKHFGTSPIEYFLNCKLTLAENLLRQHNTSVKEIATLLAYPSPQYFATKFKEKYGVSPTVLRKGD